MKFIMYFSRIFIVIFCIICDLLYVYLFDHWLWYDQHKIPYITYNNTKYFLFTWHYEIAPVLYWMIAYMAIAGFVYVVYCGLFEIYEENVERAKKKALYWKKKNELRIKRRKKFNILKKKKYDAYPEKRKEILRKQDIEFKKVMALKLVVMKREARKAAAALKRKLERGKQIEKKTTYNFWTD